MKIFSGSIKIIDIVLAIIILSVTAFAVYFAFDPKEASNKKHDSMFSPTARTIRETIKKDEEMLGLAKIGTFGFVKLSEGVGPISLSSEFSNNKFITDNLENFYIGRESLKSDIYVCFTPMSKFVRDSNCNDKFVYTLTSDGKRNPVSCDIKSVWQTEGSPWVICNPR